jgi:hypothetical protein
MALQNRILIVAAAAALVAHLGAANARAAGRKAAQRPDVAVTRVSAPRTVLAGAPFSLDVRLAERTRRAAANAVVTVSGGVTPVTAPATRVGAGGRALVAVPVTLPASGTFRLSVRAAVALDASARNNTAVATVAAADFAITSVPVTTGFAGFGAQFNQHVYAQSSRDAGVTDDNVGDMEAKVVALAPHLARLFFNRAEFADPDKMQSFIRAAQLAQRTGATIDVTWQTSWGSNPDDEMPRFADVLSDLVLNRGVTNLHWVTVQNEVNSTKISMDAYDHMVRLVDARLTQNGVRDRIRIMGGDLVESSQASWLQFMATRESDVLDAYAIHVYWDYWSAAKIARRLQAVRAIVDALPPAGRKPLYITEYGVRGHRPAGDPGPGTWDDGTPVEQTNVSAFQQAWLDVLASRLGYSAAVKWDAYFGRYDATPQGYSMIGPPGDGWPLRPDYALTRLLTQTTRPGWSVLSVTGASGTKLVSAFGDGAGALTVVGLDTSGAALNTASPASVAYTIVGLPANAHLQLLVWNADGSGTLGPASPVVTDAGGATSFAVPLQAVFALTTMPTSAA